MNDTFSFTLESPLTEEQINLITDAEFEHTDRIWFDTPKGKHIEFVKVPQWIPCSERLPDKEKKPYWICTKTGYQCECRWSNNVYGLGESDEWEWSIFDIPPYAKVVAWMPLPEPWKGEEDGRSD